jgi:tRNA (mo5U34)-methyltransferase
MLPSIPIAYRYYQDKLARRGSEPSLPSIGAIDPPARWFHSLDFGDGQVTRGTNPNFRLRGMADVVFRNGVAGKTVLDIGAWDGFYSFEAERRGAARVLATDHFCWSGEGWGTKQGFDYAHARLRSRVESLEVDLFDLNPSKLGTFDVALFLGVLYHLQDPYRGLKHAAAMTHDLLIVETVTACNALPLPVMRFYPGKELNNDPTNFWAPNTKCLRYMLQDAGFRRIEIVRNRYSVPSVSRHFALAQK